MSRVFNLLNRVNSGFYNLNRHRLQQSRKSYEKCKILNSDLPIKQFRRLLSKVRPVTVREVYDADTGVTYVQVNALTHQNPEGAVNAGRYLELSYGGKKMWIDQRGVYYQLKEGRTLDDVTGKAISKDKINGLFHEYQGPSSPEENTFSSSNVELGFFKSNKETELSSKKWLEDLDIKHKDD